MNNTTKANALKNIIRREQSKALFAQLRQVFSERHQGGLSSILIPIGETEEWETIYDQNRIEDKLIERNHKHFGQAQGTPFTVEPLSTILDWSGNTETGEQLLEGTFDISTVDTDEATKIILKNLCADEPEIQHNISVEELTSGFKYWKERTSTSPSGRHLGHYRALLAFPEEKEEGAPPNITDRFYDALHRITNTCIDTNTILPRWQIVVNVLIEKIPGTPRIDKLRVIHLFEADLNLVFGILFNRRMLRQCEKQKLLSPEQWGARSGKCANDPLLIKRLTYETINLTCTDAATFDNDAKSCYDRIVINIAMLICRQCGMNAESTSFLAKFLSDAEYRLKTKLGVSDKGYKNSKECPLFGPGQGNRASPPIWCVISDFIMQLMRKKTNGIDFTDPQVKLQVQRIMDGFVDDTTIWINRFEAQMKNEGGVPITEITELLQNAAQWWERLLFATGGKLELPKCFFYQLQWKFCDEGKPKLMTNAELQTKIEITDSDTATILTINQLEPDEAHKSLGAMIAPTGNMEQEGIRLLTKGRMYAKQLRSYKILPSSTQTSVRAIYLPRMGYTLPICSFTRQELNKIQSAPVNAILQSLGYNCHMPRAVVYGPIRLGGISIPGLYVIQGMEQTIKIIQHVRHRSSLGHMILITLEWSQLVAGVSYNLLQRTSTKIPHMTGSWLQSLRSFLAKSDLTLEIPSLQTIRTR